MGKSNENKPDEAGKKAKDGGAETPRTWWSVLWDWTRSILVAVGLALLIRWPIGEPFKIPSGSMMPTLQDGDRIFVNKFVYGVRYPFNGFRIPFTSTDTWYTENRLLDGSDPQRWDIVVFKSIEPGVKMHTLVKRIVGLPGERVLIRDGSIIVNGEKIAPPEGLEHLDYTIPFGVDYGIVPEDEFTHIPEDHYFLLGDNSGHSRDGRYWGFVPNHHILGRVSSIWWPIGRWQDFTGFSVTWWWRAIVGTLLLYTFARLFLGRSWRAYDDALGKALPAKSHVIINGIVYGLRIPMTTTRIIPGRAPRRGDVVLYHPPKDSGYSEALLLGRVAGLPGERVRVQEGTLLIDDAPLGESEPLAAMTFEAGETVGPFGKAKGKQHSLVPDDAVFILVNDGSEAPDSRTLGWIPRDHVLGVASFAWWPIGRLGRVPGRA